MVVKMRVCAGLVALGRTRGKCTGRLFQADEADDEGHGVDFGEGEFKRIIFWVVGNEGDVLLVGSGFDALDERPLRCVEDIGFVPLEEDRGHGDALAGHDVA